MDKALLDLYFKRGGIQSEKAHNQILLSAHIRKENRFLGLS